MDGEPGHVKAPSKTPLTDSFLKASPIYIGVYGMTYEQFWLGDPWIAWYYRKAYMERRKAENHRDWLLGAYVYKAISTAIGNAFRKKGQRPEDYLAEPFPIFPLTKEEQEAKELREQERGMAVLESMMRKQNARRAKEKINGDNHNPRTGNKADNKDVGGQDQ